MPPEAPRRRGQMRAATPTRSWSGRMRREFWREGRQSIPSDRKPRRFCCGKRAKNRGADPVAAARHQEGVDLSPWPEPSDIRKISLFRSAVNHARLFWDAERTLGTLALPSAAGERGDAPAAPDRAGIAGPAGAKCRQLDPRSQARAIGWLRQKRRRSVLPVRRPRYRAGSLGPPEG